MKSITVLITGAGAPGAPGIIKSLRVVRERQIRIVGRDMDPSAAGFAMVDKFVDKFYVGERAESAEFIAKILQTCEKEKVDVVIPLVTNELAKFAESISSFEEIGSKVIVSAPESLRIANNKYSLMKACTEGGIPVPESFKVESWNEFRQAVCNLGYPNAPVCFKPPVSRGLRGFRIMKEGINRLDLFMNYRPTDIFVSFRDAYYILEKAERFPELLVMEYLPGDEYSVDVLANKGEALLVVPRLREKMKMGISFVGVTDNKPEIIGYSRKVASLLKLHGNLGFQFRLDRDGIPKIVECNPRVQGTIVLCTAAGVNMVYDAVKLALGVCPSNRKWVNC